MMKSYNGGTLDSCCAHLWRTGGATGDRSAPNDPAEDAGRAASRHLCWTTRAEKGTICCGPPVQMSLQQLFEATEPPKIHWSWQGWDSRLNHSSPNWVEETTSHQVSEEQSVGQAVCLSRSCYCYISVFFHSFTFCFVVNVCYSPPDQHSFGVFWRWTELKLVKLSVTGQHVSILLLFQLNLFSLVALQRDVMLLVKHLCLLSLYLLLQTHNLRSVCSQSSQCSGLCLFTHNAIMKGDWTYGATTRRG